MYIYIDLHKALILVIDSIGEWETVSIWEGNDGKLRKLTQYPTA